VQPLVFENLTADGQYPCVECGGLHKETDKTRMFKKGLWSEPRPGDGVTESFTASAMFLPYGWMPWTGLIEEYNAAKEKLDKGAEESMIVFYNTRLARVWTREQEQTSAETLKSRAESYALQTVPEEVVYLTVAVDTQDNRFEYKVVGWGPDLEAWIIDRGVVHGQPDDSETLRKLDDDVLRREYDGMPISAGFIDSGGHYTQEIYNFCRGKQGRHIYAIKGENQPSKPILSRKTKVDINHKGNYIKGGTWVWMIGTDTAKDYIAARLEKEEGKGLIHFSDDLDDDYYEQLTAETRVARMYRGKRVTAWQKKQGIPNEAIDLMVYNLAAAYYLGLHRLTAKQWAGKRKRQHEEQQQVQRPAAKRGRRRRVKNSLLDANAW
jgi:phage terminase large subunit GpA-like protein